MHEAKNWDGRRIKMKRIYRPKAISFSSLLFFAYLICSANAFTTVTCDTETDGSGFGNVWAYCSGTTTWLWASSETLGSHVATGYLRDEIKVSQSCEYKIYVKGMAVGRLGILGLPGSNFLGSRANINVYLSVYDKITGEHVEGGDEVQIYSRPAEDWYWDTTYSDVFDKYLRVNLVKNTPYIVELKAVAITKAAGTVTALSDWGAGPIRGNKGVFWLKNTISPTSGCCNLVGDLNCDGVVSLEEVIKLINLWSEGKEELHIVVEAINNWANSP